LQNFKHELKTFYSPAKLVDYIFGFKFIDDLGTRVPEKERFVLHRDPEEYFNYLEQLHAKSYLESPYAQYIISKLGRTDRIRQLLEQRKDLRTSLRIQYQKGLIDGNEYYSRVNAFEDSIISALE
jgi:type I restriction-modification system DNA methylase subunit